MNMRRYLSLLACALAVSGIAPLHPAPKGAEVPNSYVVVFSKDATQSQIDAHIAGATGVKRTFNINNDFRAYSATFDDAALQTARNDPIVSYIDADQTVHLAGACQSQSSPPWGLARISAKTADGAENFHYDDADGSGVNVYIIDTGIRTTHNEFEKTRAFWGANFVGDGNDSDCNGHGTHVAGTVAGKTYGVAKKANVYGVKVLSCGGSGTWEGVIGGIDWTAKHHQDNGKKVSVLNMSLGGGYMAAVNAATDAAVRAGVVASVASGNSNADACNFSPASSDLAITVNAGAQQSDGEKQVDGRAYFSNYGDCTQIFAPGSSVLSAYHRSDDDSATLSGTSMAAPHVAGVAAQMISRNLDANDTPAKVLQNMQANAGKDLVYLECTNAACQRTPNLYAHQDC